MDFGHSECSRVKIWSFGCSVCSSVKVSKSHFGVFQVLLSNVSKTSKATLSRLGIFTVSSFHALVCARKPLVMPNLYGKGCQKGALLSPKGDGLFKYSHKTGLPASAAQ